MPVADPSARAAPPPGHTPGHGGWLGLGPQTLLFALYCAVFFTLRVVLSHAMEQDAATRHFEAQMLALGYGGNDPPLYTWMLAGLQRLVGVGLHSALLLNYALLTVAFAALCAAARLVLGRPAWAALAAWSLVTVPPVLLTHFALAHTVQVLCAGTLTFLAACRVVRKGRGRDYLWLGAAVGFGLLSKYNYSLLVAALAVAALVQAPVRRRLASPWMLATLAAALVVASPILAAHLRTFGQWSSTVDQLRGGGLDPLAARLSGMAGVFSSALAFVWPLLVTLLVAAPRVFDPRPAPPRPSTVDPALDRFVRDVVLAAFAVIALSVLIAGVPGFSERYMVPLLFPVPVVLVSRALRFDPPPRAARRYVLGIVATTAVVLALRLLELTPFCPQRCAELVPYDRLAHHLRADGFAGGTILTGSTVAAGNLIPHFPDSRVLVGGGPDLPPRDPPGQCLGIWDAGDWWPETARARVLETLEMSADEAEPLTRSAVIPWHGGTFSWSWPPRWQERTTEWRYVLLEDAGRCP